MNYTEYIMAESLEQAWQLNQKKQAFILGGNTWLKMRHMPKKTAIDLSALGLDEIEETAEEFRIGCMTPLRALEIQEGLNNYTDGAAREAVRHIVGVQFRNTATVGGSIFGRFGFSDVLTFFMALGTKVELYKGGILPLEDFAQMKEDNDLLVRLIVPKKAGQKVYYQSVRNTQTDFPVLTFAVSAIWDQPAEDFLIRTAVGARPGKAVYMEYRCRESLAEAESAEEFAAFVKENTVTGSNIRGSAAYRSHLAQVLAKRAALQIGKMFGENGGGLCR